MAKIISCRKCGNIYLFIEQHGTATGLYCKDCGAWQKWLGKDEKRLIEMQISEQNKPKEKAKTNFDVITESPEKLATVLSEAWNKADYEDGDYDPTFLTWLNSEAKEG